MKRFIDVFLDINDLSDNAFVEFLIAFAEQSPNWKYLNEESARYATIAGEFSCAILKIGNPSQPAVAITKKGRIYFIANIVSKEASKISMSDYNGIARSFVKDIRKYAIDHGMCFKITVSKESVDLKNIITGNRCRLVFERYMALHPRSYHSLDTERLDMFTCCLFRHSKKAFDSEALRGWLIEAMNWSEKDAEWCYRRILTGLNVLSANKKFY